MLGYPDFYDLSAWLCIGLSSGDHQAINAGVNDLNGLIRPTPPGPAVPVRRRRARHSPATSYATAQAG